MFEIARLVATYEANTGNFEAGNRRVEAGLQSTANTANRTSATYTDATGRMRDSSGRFASGAVADASRVGSAFENLGGKLKNVGGSMQTLGATLTASITLPLAGAAYGILTAGAAYETALNGLQAVTKATGAEMNAAAQLAQALGADISLPATSAKDAALAMLELGKAGMSVNQAMAASKGVLQLAAAGQLDEARAAEITANALNSFNLEASQSVRIADLLAAASNASSAGVEDIAQAMGQASATFAAAKVPIEDLTASIALLANAGIKGSDAGTSLKTFLSSIQAPSSTGADAMKKLGVSVFDATGKFVGMPTVIERFSKALSGLTDEAKVGAIQNIFGADASRAAQILFKDGEAGFLKIKEAVTAVGAAADLAMALTKGLGGAWAAFGSQLETIGINIFNVVKEPLTNALTAVSEFTAQAGAAFAGLSPAAQTAVLAFAGIAAAIGPVLAIVGTLVVAAGSVVSAFTAISGAVASAGGLATIAPLVAAAAAGMAVLAGAAVIVYEAWTTNFGNIQGIVAGFAGFVTDSFNSLAAIVQPAVDAVAGFAVDGFNKISDWWKVEGPGISAAAAKVFAFIAKPVQDTVALIQAIWERHGDTIKATITGVWNGIKQIVTGGMQVIGGVIKAVAAAINGDWSGVWAGMKQIALGGMNALVGLLKGLGSLLVGAIKIAFDAVWAMSGWLAGKAIELGSAIIHGIVNGVNSLGGALSGAIRNIASSAISSAKSVLGIQSPSKVFYTIGQDTVQGFIDGIAALRASAQGAMSSILNIVNLKGLGKGDKAGIELLSSLAGEIARIGVSGKEAETRLTLTAAAYDKLNAQIRTRIILAARELDDQDKLNKLFSDLGEAMKIPISELQGLDRIIAQIHLDALNKQLADPTITAAIDARGEAFKRYADQLKRIVAFSQVDTAVSPTDGILPANRPAGTGIGGPQEPISDVAGTPPAAPWQSFWDMMRVRMQKFSDSIPSVKANLSDALIDLPMAMGDVWARALQNTDGTIKGFFKSVALGFAQLVQDFIIQQTRLLIIKSITKAINLALGAAGGGGLNPDTVGANTTGIGAGMGSFFRASGGPVSAGMPYIVGEREPELFVPRTSGTIYNQSQLANMKGGQTVVNITNNFVANPQTGKFAVESATQAAKRTGMALQNELRRA